MNSDLFQKAQTLRDNGEIDEAVSLYQKIREESLKNNDTKSAAECLHMIGVAYYQIKKLNEAKKYLEDSLEEFEKQNNDEFAGFVLRDLGMVTKSEKYFLQSIEKLRKTKNEGQLAITQSKLGKFYADSGDFEKAVEIITSAIKILEKTTDKFFLSTAYFDLSKVYAQKSLTILNSFTEEDKFKERRKKLDQILKS